jgi:hypothetical protein
MPPRAAPHDFLAALAAGKTENDGVKNVDVATHVSKGSVAFDQNGGRRGRFSVDRCRHRLAAKRRVERG